MYLSRFYNRRDPVGADLIILLFPLELILARLFVLYCQRSLTAHRWPLHGHLWPSRRASSMQHNVRYWNPALRSS